DDIPGVLNVMKPFISAGILLPRTRAGLLEEFQHYIVYELDGAIRACASLIPYDDGQMEIAGVAVNKTFSHVGIGPKLVKYLVKQAVKLNAKSVFLLTTQTADWFENLGFYADDISTLPEARKAKWTSSRGSKVLRYDLNSVSRETE
ncbi:MAG: GNAT family N-acetyltransferase, partial [Treponema sp.]|nr:GNAT family N-acetyltransferase [Treponema sp.]